MKNISPNNFFLFFAIIFGFLYIFITPPFEAPDETNHFYRAYQISEGKFIAEKTNNRVGGYLPKNLLVFTSQADDVEHSNVSIDNIKKTIATINLPINCSERIFIDFPNTSLYTPISYIPQSISIFFLRILNAKLLFILYFSRLASLLFWITVIYISIKIIPFSKWLIVFLALLPMSLSINSSINADVMTNALSFLTIAYVLKAAFSSKKFTKKDLTILALLGIFLALSKLIYVSLIGLILIIPRNKFNSLKHQLFSFSMIFILSLGFSVIAKKSINKLYTPYNKYNSEYRDDKTMTLIPKSNMYEQKSFITNNIKETVIIFVNSFISEFKTMTTSYIGRIGLWRIQLPYFIVLISYIIIFLLAISSNYQEFNFKISQKTIFFTIPIGIIILIMLSQYLTWNPVGSEKVSPFQGRYFIPVFPSIFLVLTNRKIKLNKTFTKFIAIISILFISIYSIIFVNNEFYFSNLTRLYEVNCSSEYLNKDKNYFLTDNDTIKFKNPNIQAADFSHSGNYSIKLNKKNQFAYTLSLKNVQKGDKIIVSVWRLGNNGRIIFQEDIKNGLYSKKDELIKTDANNWELHKTIFTAPKDFKKNNLNIYIWYPANDSAYFDDFKIIYYKK